MPARSLTSMALAMAVKQSRNLEDIGDAPYYLVRPILLKIENATQLRTIEENSPQIIGEDEEVWRAIIKKDIPKEVREQHNIEPKDPANWWRVHRKLRKEGEKWQKEKDAALIATLNQKRDEKKSNTMTYVEKVIDPQKKKATTRPTIFSRAPDASSLLFGSGSRTQTKTGKGILLKAKREAKEMGVFSAKRNVLSTPTHMLSSKPMPFPMQRMTNTAPRPEPLPPAPSPDINRPTPTSNSAAPAPQPVAMKRPASSIFISNKKRRV